MPLYEYQCDNGHRFEKIRKFSDPPVEQCPTCGSPVHKLLSSPAFQFKGSGWYITDYAKKDKDTKDTKDTTEGKDSKESSEKKDGKDSKETTPTKEASAAKTSDTSSSSSSTTSTPAAKDRSKSGT